MSDALSLVAHIRSRLQHLEVKILGHPYLEALEENRLHPDSLKLFVGQQRHIISSDLRSIALILARQALLPRGRFWINVLQEEANALEALHVFAGALGLELGDLESIEPLTGAQSISRLGEPTMEGCAKHCIRGTALHFRCSRSSIFLPTCLLSRRKL